MERVRILAHVAQELIQALDPQHVQRVQLATFAQTQEVHLLDVKSIRDPTKAPPNVLLLQMDITQLGMEFSLLAHLAKFAIGMGLIHTQYNAFQEHAVLDTTVMELLKQHVLQELTLLPVLKSVLQFSLGNFS